MLRHLSWIVFVYAALASYAYAGSTLSVVYTYDSNVLEQLLNDFAKTENTKIKTDFIGVHEIKGKMMQTATPAGLPDVVIIPADQIALHGFFKYSVLDPALFHNKVPSRLWEGGVSNNQIYGAPIIQGNHLMLFCNKLLVPRVATTWDELLTQKETIQKRGSASLVWNTKSSYIFYPFLDAYGGLPLVNGKINLNTPSMVSALTFLNNLRISHDLSADCNFECAKYKFIAGKAAYIIDGVWDAKEYSQIFGDDLNISAIPAVDGNKVFSPVSTYVIAFPHDGLNGKKRELLIKLVDYLQSQPIQEKLWLQASAIPVETGAFANAQAGAKGYLQQVLSLMVDTKPIPAEESMAFMWDIIRKSLIRFQAGGMSAEEAALYMQQLSNRYDKKDPPPSED